MDSEVVSTEWRTEHISPLEIRALGRPPRRLVTIVTDLVKHLSNYSTGLVRSMLPDRQATRFRALGKLPDRRSLEDRSAEGQTPAHTHLSGVI